LPSSNYFDTILDVSSSNAVVASSPKLPDRVRWHLRVKHYSIRTEQAYVDWIRRYILFHHKCHPNQMGEKEITGFLTYQAEVSQPVAVLDDLPLLHIARRRVGTDRAQGRVLSCFRRGRLLLVAALINHQSLPVGQIVPEPWPKSLDTHIVRPPGVSTASESGIAKTLHLKGAI